MEDESVQIVKPKKKVGQEWAPLFIGSTFLATEPVLELEQHTLKDRKMRMLGERVSRYR